MCTDEDFQCDSLELNEAEGIAEELVKVAKFELGWENARDNPWVLDGRIYGKHSFEGYLWKGDFRGDCVYIGFCIRSKY